MVTFGVHPFVWTTSWSQSTVHLIEHARDLGFGALDIPCRTLTAEDVGQTKAKLDAEGMRAVAVAGVSTPYDLTSDDEAVRQWTLDYLKRVVQNARGIGATVLAGVFYGPVGRLVGRGPTESELERSAEGLRALARYAAEQGLRLALEPLTRYETYLLNTVAQGLDMVERIGEPNVGLLVDTYHMGTEEKDFYHSISAAGDRLFHFHASENDRGAPGSGLVRWDDVFRALHDIGYQGVISIESFVTSIPDIAASTCVWRRLAPDGDTLAREGLAFLKSAAERHRLVESHT